MGKYVFSQLVETKWKSVSKLPRKPRSIVDHNSKSGNLIKSSDDSVEPLEAFGYKPGVKPVSIASAGSFCANNDNTKTSDDSQTPTLRSSVTRGTSKTRSRTVVTHNLRRQTKTHQDHVLQTLHRMHEENKALAAERMATQKVMHEQKIALFGQFLDVLKAATSSNNSNSIDAS